MKKEMITQTQFRDKTPKRRKNPKTVKRHQEHKSDLKVDFRSYCGYCHCHDRYRDAFFEVDHFIPQDFIKLSGKISLTDYVNLVYSCRSCNNAKRSKWPSQNETIFHFNDEGFIDPCDDDYSKQFYRCGRGRIYPKTQLGLWMYYAFKFHIREREIELVWQLERLHNALQLLKKKQDKHAINSVMWTSIQNQLKDKALVYYDFDTELKNFRSK
jgi:hypothetical protein